MQNWYNKMPVFIQNILISAYGYYWKRRRFGGIYKTQLKLFELREKFSFEQFEEYQTNELRKMVIHAYHTVPYYKTEFEKAELTETQLANITLKELHRLPFLTKENLRKYGTTELVSSIKSKGRSYFGSSGSTGTPVQILYTHNLHQTMTAAMENRVRNWAGVTYTNPRGMIGGRRVVPEGESKGPFYRYNYFENQVYYSAYHISAKNCENYLSGMKKFQLEWMTGYTMSNYFLARFIEESGVKAPQLKAVITSSEKLTNEMRETFKRVYGCHTFDSYSGVEACGLISECEKGSLHISPEIGIIELLDENDNPIEPGEIGEAVCTGLINFDQPLIRYRIGDMIKLSKNQYCECGRQMPIVDEIVGRTEDVVIGADGREMVRFHGIFIGIPTIVEGQIIQHQLNEFEILLVVAKSLTNDENQLIKSRMISQLGKVNILIKEVDAIPRTGNGKFKAVISHVKRNAN